MTIDVVIEPAYLDEDAVRLQISQEGALYIVFLCEEEFKRTADAGAFAISTAIRKALA